MKTSTKLASATAIILTVVGTTSAFAHGNRHKFRFHNFYNPHAHVYLGGNRCDAYYDRWLETGSFYWKRKYKRCMGWW